MVRWRYIPLGWLLREAKIMPQREKSSLRKVFAEREHAAVAGTIVCHNDSC